MSTLSTDPPSLRTTLRNVSRDGATVRSSSVGSRMTMISYGRMETSPPPLVCAATDVPWQEGRLRRQPHQVTGYRADQKNPADWAASLLPGGQVFFGPRSSSDPGYADIIVVGAGHGLAPLATAGSSSALSGAGTAERRDPTGRSQSGNQPGGASAARSNGPPAGSSTRPPHRTKSSLGRYIWRSTRMHNATTAISRSSTVVVKNCSGRERFGLPYR